MGTRFSFRTSEQLIAALQSAQGSLSEKKQQLAQLFSQLGESFRDSGYDTLQVTMERSMYRFDEALQNMGSVILCMINYKERIYQYSMRSVMNAIPFSPVSYAGETVRFGAAGEALERKNRQLEFQNEVRMRMQDRSVPLAAKQAFAFAGVQCPVKNDEYTGCSHYNPKHRHIKFHLQEDLDNPCGQLAAYFHEVGHAVDFYAGEDSCLSSDPQFSKNLYRDFDNILSQTMQRYGCSVDDAYWHLRRQFAENEDLYADVSDIIGGLTAGKCQGLWGHTASYWARDPHRILQESFANMFSTSFGLPERARVMQVFFPTAYDRFLQLLEVFDDSDR